jgi:hypothetical protein
MWEAEAFITTMIFGGGLAWAWAWALAGVGVGATRDGTAARHGMATAGIPTTVVQVITHMADATTTETIGMGILKMVAAILRV